MSSMIEWLRSLFQPQVVTQAAETDPWEYADRLSGQIDLHDEDECKRNFAALTVRDRNLVAIHLCQAEWNNGGLHQFFSNLGGILAPEAAVAHAAIGMPGVAKLLKDGMRMLGKPFPRNEVLRQAKLESLGEAAFDELDNRFFELSRQENGGIDSALRQYFIKTNS